MSSAEPLDRDTDIGRHIEQWLAEDAPVQAPPDLLQRALRIPRTTAQLGPRPRWPAGAWPAHRGFPIGATVMRVLAGAAVLVLAAGLLVGTRLGTVTGTLPRVTGPSPLPAWATGYTFPRLAAGVRYYFDQPVRVSFSVPAGWLFSVTNRQGSVVTNAQGTAAFGWFTVSDLAQDPCHWQNGMVEPPIGPSVDDLLSTLEHLPGYVVSGPVTETLGGLPARHLVLTPTFDEAACDQGHSALGLYLPSVGSSGTNITSFIVYPGGTMTLWVLQVRGTRLLVLSWTRTPAVGTTTADVSAIARSIRFP